MILFFKKLFIENFLQGIRAVYNTSQPEGFRLTNLLVRCARCRIPVFNPVNPEEWYAVAMPSFLSSGGSGFKMIPERGRNKKMGMVEV